MASDSQRPKTPSTPRAAQPTAAAATPRKQLMENEVLEHATRLFAERGFSGTSLQDIATSMGLKRPALYYYFKSKDELLDRLIVEGVNGPAHELAAIAKRSDLGPAERLHAITRQNVKWVLTHTDLFLLLVKSESELSPASAKKFNAGRRDAADMVAAVIEEGVAAGELRPVNTRVAALSVFGISNWTAWWFQPGGDSIDSVADQVADMALASLQQSDLAERQAMSPRRAIAALRQDLDRLEQTLGQDRSS
ncbi:TetR/AcrR family transcriptional regulator [Aeromicrobium endophyticum]|uniref:TetR/AcrR family transcriptional regulator n=1 Tax=Aeromicrobium endophyticum TaxID=2292704 RepID=A0A371PE63_9ACTN|nr:TetR/AcrR family transcriptional regulator [Aeromicrobium endophyticum]REK73700.1 TetR/AcrR family transcriptional regulator [Aeromicrobium endophyticum]